MYPYRREVPKGYLQSVVGDAQRDIAIRSEDKLPSASQVDEELQLEMLVRFTPSCET